MDGTEIDDLTLKNLIRQVRDTFIAERVKGYTHPETGQPVPPVSADEALKQWELACPKIAAVLQDWGRKRPDYLTKRFGAGVVKPAEKLSYMHPEAQ